MNVTLIDSPVANVANIARALWAVDGALHVTRDARAISRAPKLVLPGVGSFLAARTWLAETKIDDAIRAAVANGASLLGICVGHQLLFDVSHEMGTTPGLGLLRGEVQRFEGPLPIPQIGWNRVWSAATPVAAVDTAAPAAAGGRRLAPPHRERQLCCRTPDLFDGVENGTAFYFVHSFTARHAEAEVASAEYNGPFTAAVQQGRVFGVQFHPEKSSEAGLRVLRNFLAWN